MGQIQFQAQSKLTDRYQTTVPDAVRKALRLQKREKLCYSIDKDGKVILTKFEEEPRDPVVGAFLNFLAEDMMKHPSDLRAISPDLVQKIEGLVANIEVDLNAPLDIENQ